MSVASIYSATTCISLLERQHITFLFAFSGAYRPCWSRFGGCSHLHFCNIIVKWHDVFDVILSKSIYVPSKLHLMVLMVVPRHVHRSDPDHPCPLRRPVNSRVILKSGEAVLGVTLPIVFIPHPRTRIHQFIDSCFISFC